MKFFTLLSAALAACVAAHEGGHDSKANLANRAANTITRENPSQITEFPGPLPTKNCTDCTTFTNKCLAHCGGADIPGCLTYCEKQTCESGPAHCRGGQECALPRCQAPAPNCGDCQAYFDQCLNTCGPMNHTCQTSCKAKTCIKGPAPCRAGGQCAFEYCSASALEVRQYVRAVCDDWVSDCRKKCDPIDFTCQYNCQQVVCFRGPTECRMDTQCGLQASCHGELQPTTLETRSPLVHSSQPPVISTSAITTPTTTPDADRCAVCVEFFQSCINSCPVKNPLGCVNPCKFKTCNMDTECPAYCSLGFGATLAGCPS